MRIAVQQELFSNVLKEKNTTIADTLHVFASDLSNGLEKNEVLKQELSIQINERMDNFLPSLVERLGTHFATPHEAVIL